MDALRVVIADAGRPARSALRSILNSFGDVRVVGEAVSAGATLTCVAATHPDLVLLDVRLPDIGGLEVARRLPRDDRPCVAFLSGRENQVLDAFEVGALDYLLKPVSAARLRETLDRAKDRVRLGGTTAHDRPAFDRFPVRRGHEILLLPLEEIVSITADGGLIHVTTIRNERHTLSSRRLKDLEARLDPNLFLRLSRSALANVRFIAKLTPLMGGSYVAAMANRQELTVSRAQARILRARLFGP